MATDDPTPGRKILALAIHGLTKSPMAAQMAEDIEKALAERGWAVRPSAVPEEIRVEPTRTGLRYPCTCASRRGCLEHPFGNPLPDWDGVEARATG